MNVKGTAFVTRKDTIVKSFGEERWNAFITKLAAKEKIFQSADYDRHAYSAGQIYCFS